MGRSALRSVKPIDSTRADLSSMGDQELCDRVRSAQDSDAFGELYKRHRDVAMAQAYRMTEDRGLAEDLVSETFARVLRALSNGKGPKDSVLGYVLISLRSEAIRVAQIDSGMDSVAPNEISELHQELEPDLSEALSERDQIGRAFAKISPDARRVLWLLDVEQSSIDEVAEYLGSTGGAVRTLAHRSRQKLATAYLQQYVEVSKPDCLEAAGLLAEYVRKTLSNRASFKVEDHLTTCQLCTTQVTRLGSLQQQLRVWAGPLLVGSAVGGAATIGGGVAPASAQAAEASGRLGGAAKIAGWAGLAVGTALLCLGIFTLIPKDATTVPVTPTSVSDAPAEAAAAAEEVGSQSGESVVQTPTENSGASVGEAADEAPADAELPVGESAVPQDDTTPNWKLLDE